MKFLEMTTQVSDLHSAPRSTLWRRAFASVDIAPLVWFRVLFGVIMLWEVGRYFGYDRIRAYYVVPEFHFKYYGFGWVRAWPEWGLMLHFTLMGVAALAVTIGFYFRWASALFTVCFGYVFLLDQARYLNHHYLVFLLSFLLTCTPAHRAFSWDAWRRPRLYRETAPAWSVAILRFQLVLVYFMAGVAKLSSDWVAGASVKIWLAKRAATLEYGDILRQPWLAESIAWAGLGFDLLVGPLLLWRRTRWVAFSAAMVFHLCNAFLFSIGIFPWLALGATVVLFASRLPHPWRWGKQPSQPLATTTGVEKSSRLVFGAVCIYVLVQILVPLRHLCYPGPVAWTEEGHRFSWRMLLRTKSGDLMYEVRDPVSGKLWTVNPLLFVTPKQYSKTKSRPEMILQLAHHIADIYARTGHPGVEVRAHSLVSLNGRPSALFIDPEVDLAAEPRNLWPAKWILPLHEDLPNTMMEEAKGEAMGSDEEERD